MVQQIFNFLRSLSTISTKFDLSVANEIRTFLYKCRGPRAAKAKFEAGKYIKTVGKLMKCRNQLFLFKTQHNANFMVHIRQYEGDVFPYLSTFPIP